MPLHPDDSPGVTRFSKPGPVFCISRPKRRVLSLHQVLLERQGCEVVDVVVGNDAAPDTDRSPRERLSVLLLQREKGQTGRAITLHSCTSPAPRLHLKCAGVAT